MVVGRRPAAALLAQALATLLVLLAPAAAHARLVARGTLAPEIDARRIGSDASLRLSSLRGRMVLLEFFGTDCPHCKRLVARMNAIDARYGPRGVTVLAVTPALPADVRRYRRDHGVRHLTARVPMDALRQYAVRDYPLGLLVAPDGRVLWRGKPQRLTDRVLDAYLRRVRVLPTTPPSFTHLHADLRAGRYGAVERALESRRTCRPLEDADCRFILDALAFVAWQREQAWARAAEDERRGRYHSACVTYAELAAAHAGTPVAQRATRARERLLQDPDRAREVLAWEALAQARRQGRWQGAAKEIRNLRSVLDRHGGTGAAREAGALIQILSAP